MRARRLIALLAAVASLHVTACEDEPPPRDDCEAALRLFATCGTSVPVLSDSPCMGVRLATARCVIDNAHDCDELATLYDRLDACVADVLDDGERLLPPPEAVPIPSNARQ